MLTLAQLGEFVAEHHTRDLFRLETLSYYRSDSDADDFRRYLHGDPAPTAEAKRPWLDRLQADVDAGRRWRKVHLASTPLSDYERYEFEWGFTYNVTAGEEIRIAERARTPELGALGDYFVLDHEHVVRSHYSDDGRFLGAQVLEDGAPFIAVAELLWSQTQNFNTWWAQHPQYHRGAGKAA